MNRLRIVVEETSAESFSVLYCGNDPAKADAALRDPSSKRRALFVKPPVSAFNRPQAAAPISTEAKPTEAPKSKRK
jgi:hypothetical protein